MYVDSPEDPLRSYFYQVEDCQGVFEESRIFQEYLEEIEDGLAITKELPGYEVRNTMEIVYPLFSKEISEYVQSGQNTLRKHDLIGYYDGKNSVLIQGPEALHQVFWAEMREDTPAHRQGR